MGDQSGKVLPRSFVSVHFIVSLHAARFNLLKTTPNLLCIRNQFVPRSKHFPTRL